MSPQSRSEILGAAKKLVVARHINVAGIDYNAWVRRVDERTSELLNLNTEAFEDGVRQLLSELGSNDTAF